MSKKEHIIDGSTVTALTKFGMIYTCKCGWIDLGHANPESKNPNEGAANLWKKIISESGTKSPNGLWYKVTYEQTMAAKKFGIGLSDGVSHDFAIRIGLSHSDKESAALAIFLAVSNEFEKLQSEGKYAWYTDSGFSAEDLPSNLLGFYRTVRPGIDYIKLCEPVSAKAAHYLWETYGGPGRGMHKTYGLNIVLFPCIDCDKPTSRKVFPLPPFLSAITAAKPPTNFRIWNDSDPDLTTAPAPIAPPPFTQNTHPVIPGDTLSLLAKRYLFDPQLWALIWFENQSTIGTNYNVLKPGMILKIPQMPVPEATLKRAREVARNWKPGLNWR